MDSRGVETSDRVVLRTEAVCMELSHLSTRGDQYLGSIEVYNTLLHHITEIHSPTSSYNQTGLSAGK